MSVLQNVIIISLFFRIWSGRKKLRPEDLVANASELPPEQLVSLGSKKIFDPEALKPFYELKREAESACQQKGIKFLKGFAVPKDEVPVVLRKLNDICRRFEEAKRAFIAGYDDARQEWKQQYPGFAHIIEKDVLSKEEVALRISSHYQQFAVNEVDEEIAKLGVQGGADLVVGLAGQLFIEIASETQELVRRSLDGRTEVTQKFLRPLRAIRSKLSGLRFVDGNVEPVLDELDKVLGGMPKSGKIAGAELAALRGVCALLSDPARMRRHGHAVLSVTVEQTQVDRESDDADSSDTTESAEDRAQPDFAELEVNAQVPAPIVGQRPRQPSFEILL